MKINEVIEQARTCQIEQESVVPAQRVQTLHPTNKVAQISTEPIPDELKHRLVQRRLTKKFMRKSNIVKPTVDDVRIARSRAETMLKRADLEYQRSVIDAG